MATIFDTTSIQLPQLLMKNSSSKTQTTSTTILPPPIIIRTDDNNIFEEWIEDQSDYILNNNNNDNNSKDKKNNNTNVLDDSNIRDSFSVSLPINNPDNLSVLYNNPIINSKNKKSNQINNNDDDDLSHEVTPQLSSAGISEFTTTDSSLTNSSNSGSMKTTPPQFIFKKPSIKKSSLLKEIKHAFSKKSKKSRQYTSINIIKVEKYGHWGKVLGSGVGGTVRLIHRASDGKTFASKQFRDRYPRESEKSYRKKIISEFCIGSALHHENIIETLDIVQENNQLHEIMEYAPYDLFEAVMSKQMSENEIACVFRQIVNGINYLHEMGIVHRDIKLDNICINKQGIIKIIDFGCAAVFKYHFNNKIMLFRGPIGSDPYICPESYTREQYDARAADIWAIGVTFVCMNLSRFPWLIAKNSDEIFKAYVKKPERLIKKLPELSRPLLRRILEIDPEKRATMKDILNDEWFKSIQVCSTNNNVCNHIHHLIENEQGVQTENKQK